MLPGKSDCVSGCKICSLLMEREHEKDETKKSEQQIYLAAESSLLVSVQTVCLESQRELR